MNKSVTSRRQRSKQTVRALLSAGVILGAGSESCAPDVNSVSTAAAIDQRPSLGGGQDGSATPDAAEIHVSTGTPTRNRRGLLRRRRWSRTFGEQLTAGISYPQLIVVKMFDGSNVRLRSGELVQTQSPSDDDLDRLSWAVGSPPPISEHLRELRSTLGRYPGVVIRSLIPEAHERTEQTARESRELRAGSEFEDLASIFLFSLPHSTEEQSSQLLARLRQNQLVEYAYWQPRGSTPRSTPACTDQLPGVTTAIPPLFPSYHRRSRPSGAAFLSLPPGITHITAGHDIDFAASVPGGLGASTTLVDVEAGFHWEHEHLPDIMTIHGINNSDSHGTASFGVATGCSTSFGPPGIAPAALSLFSSVWDFGAVFYAPSGAIHTADEPWWNTDVILIEQQMWDFSTSGCYNGMCEVPVVCTPFVPVEYYPAEHATIRAAVGNGRVVVEAAGNGSRDLDNIPGLNRMPWVDPQNSGALLVGGVGTDTDIDGHQIPACSFGGESSNVGGRVDIGAFFGSVSTTGYGSAAAGSAYDPFRFNTSDRSDPNQWYTDAFAGTSSASAIVAGAALSLIGMWRSANTTTTRPNPYDVTRFLAETGNPNISSIPTKVGPTLQLGMAATAFGDRVVGDGADTTAISEVGAAVPVITTGGTSILLTARRTDGRYIHNSLRGGAWYGWSVFPSWNSGGVFGTTTLTDLQVRQLAASSTILDAIAVDGAGRVLSSRSTTIDPQASNASPFTAWQAVPSALTGTAARVSNVEFSPGYHDTFVATTAGTLRWIYRAADSTTFASMTVSLPVPVTLSTSSRLIALSNTNDRADLFAIDSTSRLVHASVSGTTFTGWDIVPGGANATMLDAVVVSNSQIALAAGWVGGTTVFVLNTATNTWSAGSLIYGEPQMVAIAPTGSDKIRVTAQQWPSGVRVTRGATISNGVIASPSSYQWNTTEPSGGVTATTWRSQLGLAFGINSSSRAVFRVLDRVFPVL